MTTGQRISAKRRERELSQESLGETLGVSRQSIYKWESDSSLPEIEKLVAMSRLFGVSVGWLLGVEETPEKSDAEVLSQAQLDLVEEILRRYQHTAQGPLSEEQLAQVDQRLSQAPDRKKTRRRWMAVFLFAVCGFLVSSILTINSKVDRVQQQSDHLSNSINNISSSVNRQIGTITNRVEEVLKSQNSLTADYGTQLVSGDLAQNTVTLSLRAVPKTYSPGMEAVFLADSGDGPGEFPAVLGPDRAFTAEITCPLTDSVTLSVVFISGDTRQTQLLDCYSGLYSGSMPVSDMMTNFHFREDLGEDGLFHFREQTGWITFSPPYTYDTSSPLGQSSIQSVRLGLFRSFSLIQWLEPGEPQEGQGPDWEGAYWFHLPALDLALKEGETLHLAALVTDQYGRTAVVPDIPPSARRGDELRHIGGDVTGYLDPSAYSF